MLPRHRLEKIDKSEIEKLDTERFKQLCEEAAEEIKTCANACDTYDRSCVAIKFLRSTQWNERFKELVVVFEKRRSKFDTELAVFQSLKAVEMSHQLHSIQDKSVIVNSTTTYSLPVYSRFYYLRMDRVLKYIDSCSRSSGLMSKLDKARNDDEELRSFLEKNPLLYMSGIEEEPHPGGAKEKLRERRLKDVMKELNALSHGTAESEKRNLEQFNRLFRLVEHQTDRIIQELTKTIRGSVVEIQDAVIIFYPK